MSTTSTNAIILAVATVSCSATTVSTVQSILSRTSGAHKTDFSRKKGPGELAVKRGGKTANAQAKGPIKVHTEEPTSVAVKPEERSAFATDIINAALKALSAAAKQQHQPAPTQVVSELNSTDNPLKEPTISKQGIPRSRNGARPLQARSLNSPEKPTGKRNGPHDDGSLKRSITATADCARTALEYVRRNSKNPETLNTTLENGTLAFVSKCITLGLESLATNELREMKKRLEASVTVKTTKKTVPKSSTTAREKTAADPKDDLCTFLDLPATLTENDASCGIVTSFQTQVLRLIAAVKRPFDAKALLISLHFGHPSSPVALILKQNSGTGTKPKCSKNLETVAQIILSSICPGTSASHDAASNDASQFPNPDSVIRLQALALRVRILALEQSDRSCMVEHEIWTPFSKCLAAFHRRSTSKAEIQFRLAKAEFGQLDAVLDVANVTIDRETRMPSKASCLRTLSDLAQSAGLYDEAICLTENSTTLTPTKSPSSVKKAISSVRLARLMLLGCKEETLRYQMDAARDGLINQLRGEAADLDQLLLEAASYRRAMMSRFLAEVERGSPDKDILNLCVQGVFGCIRFLLRYLGTKPVSEAEEKTVLRYNEKVLRASKAVSGFTDAVLHCCKAGIQDGTFDFASLNTALHDCYQVALAFTDSTYVNEATGPLKDKAYDPSKVFTKVSTLYWAYYNRSRKSSSSNGMIQSLKRSIEVLESGDWEVRKSGAYSSKMEALAHSYEMANRYQSAYDIMISTMTHHHETGNLVFLEQVSSSHSFEGLWATPVGMSVSASLDRIAILMLRASKTGTASFDWFSDTSLNVEGQAILLERQIYVYCNEVLKGKFSELQHGTTLNSAFSRLFGFLPAEEYPVRRQRAAVLASCVMNQLPETLDRFIIEQLSESQIQGSVAKTSDWELETYSTHFNTVLKVNLSLANGKMDLTRMKEALGTWQRLLEDNPIITDRVDGLSSLRSQLQILADYFDVICVPYLRTQTLSLLLRYSQQVEERPSLIIETQCQIALQYIRMGYSGKAGMALAKCRKMIEGDDIDRHALLEYHLAYANYSLSIGNSAKCKEHLATAERLVAVCPELSHLMTGEKASSLTMLMKGYQTLSQALEVTSLMLLQTGSMESALQCARRCVKILQRIWVLLESSPSQPKTQPDPSGERDAESSDENSSSKPSNSGISYECLKGARFWKLIPQLRRAYYIVSEIYSTNGLFYDSQAAASHAQRVVEALSSPLSMIHQYSVMADLWIRGGDIESGQRYLDQAVEIKTDGPSLELAKHHGTVAKMWKARGEVDDEIDALDQAFAILEKLLALNAMPIERIPALEDILISKLSSMTIDDEAAPPARRGKLVKKAKPSNIKTTSRTKTKPAALTKPKSPQSLPGNTSLLDADFDCVPLQGMRARVLVDKAIALQDQKNLELAKEILSTASEVRTNTTDVVRKKLAEFRQSTKSAFKSIVSDCTFGLLPESTISIPSLAGDVTALTVSLTSGTKAVNKKARSAAARKKSINFTTVLAEARTKLLDFQLTAAATSSPFEYYQLCNQLVSTSFYLAAAVPSNESQSAPLAAAWLLDHPSIIASRRSRAAAKMAEKSFEKPDLHEWPAVDKLTYQTENEAIKSLADFQLKYIDIIPQNWTVISLNLAESKEDLYITKYAPGQMPFLLRLPLKCNNHSLDEEAFGYEEVKAELLEIIELSNETAKDAAELSADDLEAKNAWWTEREELDSKLEELLVNIERIWLGGFCGVFSNQDKQSLLLARFQKALLTSFSRHLPSRQGKGQQAPLHLDPRVYELFTGLGEPKDDDDDFDSCLADLLHFIVDTLQFHGEANAYDEIDFDSLIVETTDALKAYHSASINPDDAKQRHTILVLDKDLHFIPWESFACMSGINVSRLDSLESLRSKLLVARETQKALDVAGHRVSRTSGVSLLNPSGDLVRTEKTLRPLLDSLGSGWTHSSSKPTEEKLTNHLSSTDLYLYFGHGSGSQFIRSRTLRDKERCPTAWLMGCSSAALSTHGEFQPSAFLLSLLDAGAPAVLGCLWDVTDKDCDRASIRIGDMWGLWNIGKDQEKLLAESKSSYKSGKYTHENSSFQEVEKLRSVKSSSRSLGPVKTGRSATSGTNGIKKPKSLVEAVRLGRESCRLRYLNGAALVVYGIPVYLDD